MPEESPITVVRIDKWLGRPDVQDPLGGFDHVHVKIDRESVKAHLHHAGQREHVQRELQELLAVLNGRLTGRSWLLGESFTLADLIVASVVLYGTFCGMAVDEHAQLRDWLARFQARPAFQAVWGTH